jgi:oligosaccharide translocation protein RFT1
MSTAGATGSTRALRGAGILIILQVISRALTFLANQLLVRYLTPQLLGVATQLEVYYLSVIFFARESLRVAIQRQDTSSLPESGANCDGKSQDDKPEPRNNKAAQAAVNLGYLALILGIPLAVFFAWLYLGSLSAVTLASAPNLVVSLYIYAIASVVELASEPVFVLLQTRLKFGVRATAESVATFLRCSVTLASAIWGARRDFGVLPFALGQLSYGVGLLAVYSWHGASLSRHEGFSLLPRRLASSANDEHAPRDAGRNSPVFFLSYFYRPTLQLASSMMAQSVVKHLLTQGDTLMVSALASPTAQGVYALANNYGGLVARLLFQPIEESSRSYFSRLLAEPSSSKSPTDDKQPAKQEINSAHAAALDALRSLFKAYLLLALLAITLGPSAAGPLLALVAGRRWAVAEGAAACLSAYAYYIPFLALNGVAEAFVASVASEREVHLQSAWMAGFSAAFGVAGFVFLRVLEWGAVGLVVANGINMACRIVWCTVFIRWYFARRGLKFDLLSVMPGPGTVLAGAVASPLVRRVGAGEGPVTGARDAIVQLTRLAAVALPFLLLV